MVETNKSFRMPDGGVDRMALRASLKYLHFGQRLMMLREKRGMRSSAVADFLSIPRREYMQYESGEVLPDMAVMSKLAKMFEVPLQKFMEWSVFARHQAGKKFEENAVVDGSFKYTEEWQKTVEKFNRAYKEAYSTETVSPEVQRAIVNLERAVTRTFKLPVLPMPLFMLLSTLAENKNEVVYLHEIADYVLDGESFAGWVARDPYLGPFVTFAANRVYFQDAPSSNITDCLNRLTLDQFKTLLLVALHPCGIYGFSEDLVSLQQHHEFASLGALMAIKMKSYLPPTINFDHLYACLLTQSVSTHAFYSLIMPSLLEDEQNNDKQKKDVTYKGLSSEVMNLINYEMHPVVSGMIAANWGYPTEVIKCLIDHHTPLTDAQDHPNQNITPLNATLKFINFFVDCNFPIVQGVELTELMRKYPQINISEEILFKVIAEMNKLKEHLVEMSSSMIESRSRQVSQVTSKRIKQFMDKSKTTFEYNTVVLMNKPKSSEFRFDPEYQQALINECYQLYVSFIMEMILLRKGESLESYEKRMGNFQLAFHYTASNKIEALTDTFRMPADVVNARLKQLMTR